MGKRDRCAEYNAFQLWLCTTVLLWHDFRSKMNFYSLLVDVIDEF